MEELKPCPFCGGTKLFVGTIAEIELTDEDHPDYSTNSEFYSVVCDYTDGGCGASVGGASRSASEAITAWNRRVNRCQDCLVDRMIDDGK